jgi:Rrf2 family transcriptional regulator, iron-sulfur cluster assembly transcription factor
MAMADLAKHDGADPVPLSAVAERQHISLAYLEQLFLRLRRAGLVNSERGRAGGYRLGRDAASITVAEVMAAVEEGTRMTRCAGELGTPCLPGERCLTHGLWDALGEHIGGFLAGVTLKDVLAGIPRPKGSSIAAPSGQATGGSLETTIR